MAGYGYNNYHYAQEWEQNQWKSFGEPPYQQYSQYPLEVDRSPIMEHTLMQYMDYSMDSTITRLEDSLNQLAQLVVANQKNTESNQKNTEASIKGIEIQLGHMAKQLSNLQGGTFSENTQTNPKEHGDSMSIICDEVIGKSTHGETIVVETKGNEMFHQTPPLIAKNVVEEDEKEKEELVEQQEETKQKREKEDKDEIDRVIDSICALFTKVQLEETWKPHHLYLKFMEFLPNKLKKLDDVLSMSFWPP